MPIGIIEVELRDKKDHFVTTLYKEVRNKFGLKQGDILLLEINNQEFIKIPNKDFHITIPKKLVNNYPNRTKLKILKIYDNEKARSRTNKLFDGKDADIKAFVPEKTIFGDEIFVLDCRDYIYAWYNISGGAKPIKIKKKFNAEKLAELVGFYFGDGNTSEGIRSFRINNCESSTLNYCLDILEELGLPRKVMKVQIIYSTPNYKLEEVLKEKCIGYWSKILSLDKNQIVSVNRSYGKTESLEYGSARIFFDNATFVEILLNGILKRFVKIIKNPQNKLEETILVGFLRGLAAAEGSVTLTKLNSLSKVSLSFDPHSEDLEFYKEILNRRGIISGGTKGNELYVYGIKNFNIFKNIDLFKMHYTRKEKFLEGFANHKFSN